MSSWLKSSAMSAFGTLTDTVSKATEKVKEKVPDKYIDGLAKLTLNTEEMINERRNFREEAARKEEAKNRLNKLMPWETYDAEREILVDECKEAILALSSREETFFGPYDMPLLNVQLVVQDNGDDEEEEDPDNDVCVNEDGVVAGEEIESEHQNDSTTVDNAGDADDEETRTVEVVEEGGEETNSKEEESYDDEEEEMPAQNMDPTEETKEMLEKLQPLPPLLEDFDLDSHVGLIQNLLKVDPELVKMQAKISGGGGRELIFWKNYFFHCAFTRYECGLSIDEIWSYESDNDNQSGLAPEHENIDDKNDLSNIVDENGNEEVVASGDTEEQISPTDGVETSDGADADVGETDALNSDGSPNTSSNGFEMVDDTLGDDCLGGELDELEAEIARELEG